MPQCTTAVRGSTTLNALDTLLAKVRVDGHGRRSCTYFQGWVLSSHFLGKCSLDGQMILRKMSEISATSWQIIRLESS